MGQWACGRGVDLGDFVSGHSLAPSFIVPVENQRHLLQKSKLSSFFAVTLSLPQPGEKICQHLPALLPQNSPHQGGTVWKVLHK